MYDGQHAAGLAHTWSLYLSRRFHVTSGQQSPPGPTAAVDGPYRKDTMKTKRAGRETLQPRQR